MLPIISISSITISNLNTSIVHVVNKKETAVILKYPALVPVESTGLVRLCLGAFHEQSKKIIPVH